jgi:hypothetical protein
MVFATIADNPKKMYSLNNKFVPSFGHFAALLIGAAIAFGVGFILSDNWARFTALVIGAGLGLASFGWLWFLYIESRARHYIAGQETEQRSLELVLKANADFAFLPPAARLQALHKLFPELDLGSIHIPQEVAPQISTAPNESFEHRVNISRDEMATLRRAVVEFGGRLSRRKMCPDYFSDPRWREIYQELKRESPNHVSYAVEVGDGSLMLTDAGYKWLGLSPTSPPEGFSPINPHTSG